MQPGVWIKKSTKADALWSAKGRAEERQVMDLQNLYELQSATGGIYGVQ